MASARRSDVVPAPEARVDALVRQRGEATVARGREGRQDVDPPEEPGERPVEEGAERGQVAPERIRVRQQLRRAFDTASPWHARPCSVARRMPLQRPRQLASPVVGDAAHLVVDVGEPEPCSSSANASSPPAPPWPKLRRPEQRRAGGGGELRSRYPSGPRSGMPDSWRPLERSTSASSTDAGASGRSPSTGETQAAYSRASERASPMPLAPGDLGRLDVGVVEGHVAASRGEGERAAHRRRTFDVSGPRVAIRAAARAASESVSGSGASSQATAVALIGRQADPEAAARAAQRRVGARTRPAFRPLMRRMTSPTSQP